MYRDCAVQTTPSPPGITLLIDDHHHRGHLDDASPAADDDPSQWMPGLQKDKALRSHFAQFGEQQHVTDDFALGWDCGICFETAEDPCVTRCGHLYCQAHLHHWLATHPSCPVCKAFCTPSADVVPIFSRGRSSTPSSSSSASSSSGPSSPDTVQQPYFRPPSPLPSPSPTAHTFPLSAGRTPNPTPLPASPSGDFDFHAFPLSPPWPRSPSPRRSTPPPPPQSPLHSPLATSPLHCPPSDDDLSDSRPLSPLFHLQPHPHPLLTAHALAHRAGVVLRVVALAIFLAVLLR